MFKYSPLNKHTYAYIHTQNHKHIWCYKEIIQIPVSDWKRIFLLINHWKRKQTPEIMTASDVYHLVSQKHCEGTVLSKKGNEQRQKILRFASTIVNVMWIEFRLNTPPQ